MNTLNRNAARSPTWRRTDVPGAAASRSAAYTVGQRAKIGGVRTLVRRRERRRDERRVRRERAGPRRVVFHDGPVDGFWVSALRGAIDVGARLLAKTRYASPLTPVIVRSTSTTDEPMIPSRYSSSYRSRESSSPPSLAVRFSSRKAGYPGQALVLYDGDVCLGGGIVERVGPSLFESNARA